MKLLWIVSPLLIVLTSCKPEVKPIEYGSDMCKFCKMTVVDMQYGAELVTSKGKVFVFDAIECMVDYLRNAEDEKFALQLVNTYTDPGNLVEAQNCYYLISEAMPSPMGAYLTAFRTESELTNYKTEKGGDGYSWEALKDLRSKN